MARPPVRLSDVAAVAGVSVPTASKVLNGRGRVAPATRERILDAAARLDFQPDALAQFFATGRSRTIGVLTQNAPGTFTMPVLVGAMTALGAQSLATLVLDGIGPDNIRTLQARRIDGLLVVGDGLYDRVHSVTEQFDVAVVYAFGVSDRPEDVSFVPDSVMAGRVGVEHLLDIGRRRIVHITARHDLAADDRLVGIESALADAGLELVVPPLRGNWSRAWGLVATRRLLEQGVEFDAIYCGNDEIAQGAFTELRDAGRRVPEDVALLGVDNWPGLPDEGDHLLSTIDPNLGALGAAAARFLMAPGAADHGAGVVTHPCTLIVGASTTTSSPSTTASAR